ncbi:MAG TPA: hypothetical protein VGC58_00085 [Candidatus Paceibacterota bacterium]
MDILEVLSLKGLINKKDIKSIREEAASSGLTVEETLIKKGISPQDILIAKGEYFDIPVSNLSGITVPKKVLDYIPEDTATRYRFVPIDFEDDVLHIGMVNPDDMEARDALNFISSKVGLPFKIFIISESDYSQVLNSYKGLTGEVSKTLTDLDKELNLVQGGS